jgi:hypothetical protein
MGNIHRDIFQHTAKQPGVHEIRFNRQTALLEIQKSILRCLAYFDMFSYPLLQDEVHRFMDRQASVQEVLAALHELLLQESIFCFEGYYTLRNDAYTVPARLQRNRRADTLLATAYRIGKRLSRFPFVRGVGISGSLSKHCADEHSDIDFFIITSPNRLWIARTLLHCLKKISFLTGRQHWYCMNYFIDEDALALPEQNMFIAVELVTLKPVSGQAMQQLLAQNSWAYRYLPNYTPVYFPVHNRQPWHQLFAEYLLNNRIGAYIDNMLMRFTRQRWLDKQRRGKCNSRGELMSLCVHKHYGKPDPGNFQQKIMELYAAKCRYAETLLPVQEIHFLRKEII